MTDTESAAEIAIPPSTPAVRDTKGYPKIDVKAVRAAVQATDYALALSGIRVPASVQVRWKAGFTTASWCYKPPHLITIGDRLLVRAKASTRSDPLRTRAYIQSYYEHELAHACYTVSDLDSVVRTLAIRLDLPNASTVEAKEIEGERRQVIAPWLAWAFRLSNLFEDARIEHRWRLENRRCFGWNAYEQLPVEPADSALACFLRRVQAEGGDPTSPGVDQAIADRYYAACCAAPDTWAIVDLVAMWWREVGSDIDSSIDDSNTDLVIALALHLGCMVPSGSEGETDPEQWEDENCIVVTSEIEDTESENPSGKPIIVETPRRDDREVSRSAPAVQLSKYPVTMSTAAIDRLAVRLGRILGRQDRHIVTSWSPSRRVSARAVLTGRAPFRHTLIGKGRAVSIALYVDCSGSMDGHHIEEARLLIAALSRLALAHHVVGEVILAAYDCNQQCHTVLPLPIPEETIERIVAYANGEGLEAALHATAELVRQREVILVYSDGEITDAPIDRAALQTKGVKPIGCYVGDERQAERLSRWFAPVLVAPTAEELVDLIVRERQTR